MVQQLRKLVQRYKIFSLFVGGIDEFSGKLGREMKVRFDKLQNPIELAVLEDVIGACYINH